MRFGFDVGFPDRHWCQSSITNTNIPPTLLIGEYGEGESQVQIWLHAIPTGLYDDVLPESVA